MINKKSRIAPPPRGHQISKQSRGIINTESILAGEGAIVREFLRVLRVLVRGIQRLSFQKSISLQQKKLLSVIVAMNMSLLQVGITISTIKIQWYAPQLLRQVGVSTPTVKLYMKIMTIKLNYCSPHLPVGTLLPFGAREKLQILFMKIVTRNMNQLQVGFAKLRTSV